MPPIIIPIITLLWSGMLLGISLASWAKFKTSSLIRPVGLDVGRTVFATFHKAQFILLVILIVSGLMTSLLPHGWLVIGLIALILVLQSVWIFSILSSRINAILAGAKTAKSHAHTVYGILEFAKLALLFYLLLKVENL